MSAYIYGIGINDIIPQSDFEATQTENGGWSATQSFKIIKGGISRSNIRNFFFNGGKLVDLDPNADTYFNFLYLTKISSIRTEDGGWTIVTCVFEGVKYDSQDPPVEGIPNPTYAKRGVLATFPIEEHPKWKALGSTEKTILGYLLSGLYVWDISAQKVLIPQQDGSTVENETLTAIVTGNANANAFAERLAQGTTTYTRATYDYTVRWEEETPFTSDQLNSLGKISNTPVGSPATPSGTRNWMLIGVNELQEGSGDYRFKKELVYQMSESGGYDTFLYASA